MESYEGPFVSTARREKVRRTRLLLALVLLGLVSTPLLLRLYYRVDHLPLILKASREQDVSPHLVAAIIFTESRFRSDARSHAGAAGLMQLMPETAREMAEQMGIEGFRPEQLSDPAINITLGVAYLKYLLWRFNDPRVVLAAYNAGPTVVEQWLEEGKGVAYPETQNYVNSVLRHQRWLQGLYPEWESATAP
jgi:soluble lytic murein transglycosylase